MEGYKKGGRRLVHFPWFLLLSFSLTILYKHLSGRSFFFNSLLLLYKHLLGRSFSSTLCLFLSSIYHLLPLFLLCWKQTKPVPPFTVPRPTVPPFPPPPFHPSRLALFRPVFLEEQVESKKKQGSENWERPAELVVASEAGTEAKKE